MPKSLAGGNRAHRRQQRNIVVSEPEGDLDAFRRRKGEKPLALLPPKPLSDRFHLTIIAPDSPRCEDRSRFRRSAGGERSLSRNASSHAF